jgi:sugar lactone lactonase YvrE
VGAGSVPDVVLEDVSYAEGLRWHDDRLWFSDMLRDQVCTLDLRGRVEKIFEISEPSGLGFLPDGRVVIVCRGSGSLLVGEPGLGTATLSALTEQGVVGVNDLVTDHDGRSYVGSLGVKYQLGDEDRSWSGPAPGRLLCYSRTANGRLPRKIWRVQTAWSSRPTVER